MKTLLTFTMTPTEPMVTILAGTLIIAGVALLVTYILLHQARTEREQAIKNSMMWTDEASKLKRELFKMSDKRDSIGQELEWERVKHKANAKQSATDIEQWKALYIEQLNRANRFEELHTRMTKRPRDPKTGRFVNPDKENARWALNLCEEIKQRAVEDVAPEPKPHTLRHGMTVKDPTPEQAKEIFDEAKRLGIAGSSGDNPDYPWITFNGMVRGRTSAELTRGMSSVSPEQFLAHMRGEA